MGHVFISYSKKDLVYAMHLSKKLKRERFDPWLDVERLKAGTSWQERLHLGVEACDAYILIMSPNSKQSKWVENELLTAQNLGKPIFPLLLEDTRTFLAIQTIQYEDVRGSKMPPDEFYERLEHFTPRRKKARRKDELPFGLTEKEQEKKSDAVAKQASYIITKVASTVKDTIAVASKATKKTYESVADSRVMKNIFSKGRSKKSKPGRKLRKNKKR